MYQALLALTLLFVYWLDSSLLGRPAGIRALLEITASLLQSLTVAAAFGVVTSCTRDYMALCLMLAVYSLGAIREHIVVHVPSIVAWVASPLILMLPRLGPLPVPESATDIPVILTPILLWQSVYAAAYVGAAILATSFLLRRPWNLR